ncbi:LIM domain only protein 7 [Cichlidogyrus casuarinus]|uniref:LIM domain only protein 7 n=1 Tax=Cichlidogyrus casuarinus TaxID=1844966 RepID=A0ABD2QE80_9PLAT
MEADDEWQERVSQWRERRKKSLLNQSVPLDNDDEESKLKEAQRIQEIKNQFSELRKLRSLSLESPNDLTSSDNRNKFESIDSLRGLQSNDAEIPTNKSGTLDPEALERARNLIDKEKQIRPTQLWEDRLTRLSNTLKSSTLSEASHQYQPQQFSSTFASLRNEDNKKSSQPQPQLITENVTCLVNSKPQFESPRAQDTISSDLKDTTKVKIHLLKRPGSKSTNEINWGFTLTSDLANHLRGSVVRVDKVKIGSSADLCELKSGDVLLAIDEKPILDTTNTFLSVDEVNQQLLSLSQKNRPIKLLVQRRNHEDFDPDDLDDSQSSNDHVPPQPTLKPPAIEHKEQVSGRSSISSYHSEVLQHVAVITREKAPPMQAAPERTLVLAHEVPVLTSASGEFSAEERSHLPSPTCAKLTELVSLPSSRDSFYVVTTESAVNLPTKSHVVTLHRAQENISIPVRAKQSEPAPVVESHSTSDYMPRVVPIECLENMDKDQDSDSGDSSNYSEKIEIPVSSRVPILFDEGSLSSKAEQRRMDSLPRTPILNGSARTSLGTGFSNGTQTFTPIQAWPVPETQEPLRKQMPSLTFLGAATTSLQSTLGVLENRNSYLNRDYSANPHIPPRGGFRTQINAEIGVPKQNYSTGYQMGRNPMPCDLGIPRSKPLKEPIPPLPFRTKKETPKNSLSFSRKPCEVCKTELGYGDLMIIEKLGLHYHLHCFRCSICNCPLSDGLSDAEVRVRKRNLFCFVCYRRRENSPRISQTNSSTRLDYNRNSSSSRSNNQAHVLVDERPKLSLLDRSEVPVHIPTDSPQERFRTIALNIFFVHEYFLLSTNSQPASV